MFEYNEQNMLFFHIKTSVRIALERSFTKEKVRDTKRGLLSTIMNKAFKDFAPLSPWIF